MKRALAWSVIALVMIACKRPVPRALVKTDASVPSIDAAIIGPPNTPDVLTGLDVGIDTGPIDVQDPWTANDVLLVDYVLPESGATGPLADKARAAMITLRLSIGFWRVGRHAPDACPTMDDLAKASGTGFDRASMESDPWGHPYQIVCNHGVVTLRSSGPDGIADTGDDLWSH